MSHSATISGTVVHSHGISGNVIHTATISATTAHSQAISGLVYHSAALNGTTAHSQSITGHVSHLASINGTVAHSQSIIGYVQHKASINGTTAHSQSITGLAYHTASIQGTVGHKASITGTTVHTSTILGLLQSQLAYIVGTVGHKASITGNIPFPFYTTPSTAALKHPNSAPQAINISYGPITSFSATSANTSIATAAIYGSTLIVTPVAQGSTTITVTASDSTTITVPVTVGAAAGAFVFSVPSLGLTNNGALGAQTVTISRANDTDPFTIQSVPAGFLTITGGGSGPGPVSYSVSTTQVGSGLLVVTGSDGVQASIPVSGYGPLTAFVTSRKNAQALTVLVSEQGYNGAFNVSFVGTNSATLLPAVGYGPTQVYTITDATPGQTFLLKITDARGSAPTFLTLQSRDVTLGSVACTFVDETTYNPIPAGVQYQVYYQGDPIIATTTTLPSGYVEQPTLVQGGYVGVNGLANIVLDQNSSYVVLFSGEQAPTVQALFSTTTATTQQVVVTGYQSPNGSQTGYAARTLGLWTTGWVGDEYKQPGPAGTTGIAFAVGMGFASTFAELDTRQQTVTAATRLDSCVGAQVDSFAADFFAGTLQRQVNEADTQYIARIKNALNPEITTYSAILSGAQFAYNSSGFTGALTIFDLVGVWDGSSLNIWAQSPNLTNLATALSLSASQFVILLPQAATDAFSFFAGDSYLGVSTYIIPHGTIQTFSTSTVKSTYPLMYQAVESRRAAGTTPIYAQLLV